MTKKHFIALADAIRDYNESSFPHGTNTASPLQFTHTQVIRLADFCGEQNDRFNRERWLGYIAGTNGKNEYKAAQGNPELPQLPSRVIGKRHTPSQNDAPEYYSEPAQAQHSAEQTSVKLHDALIGEERLAEVAQRLAYAVSDLINEPRTIEIEHYAETALQDYEKARAQ